MPEIRIKNLILYAVTMAMGISGLVTTILVGDLKTVMILYGLGVAAAGIAGLDKENSNEERSRTRL